jgi:16S rRNA (guanine527-N7)-methyltransferase
VTEDEARQWIRDRFGVPRETALVRYAELIRNEAGNQNLVSAPSLEAIWTRHFVDSAQLLDFAQRPFSGTWLDIGSGAGLPGLVIAIISDCEVILVEPRRKRAEFLQSVVNELGLAATVIATRIEQYRPKAAVRFISARAVSSLSNLFENAQHCSSKETVWLLPKGRSAQSELELVRKSWQGSFHVEQSLTQAGSMIVVAQGVQRR